jgi:hypothetical protein
MKKLIPILIMSISTIGCFGQTLFFDDLVNSTWKSEPYFNDTIIKTIEEIGLRKLKYPVDSLKANATIWNFKDGSLTVKYYDCRLKKESLIATYNYAITKDAHEQTLKITGVDNTTSEYVAGVASTGGFALLMRKKEKEKK